MSVLLLAVQSMAWAADRSVYLKHSSGMVAGRRSDGRAVIFSPSSAETVKLSLRPVGDGYYLIVHKQADGTETYMTLNGSWNTYFEDDSSTDKALYAIDGNETEMFRLRNKSNGRYLGTDANDSGSNIYSDKDGNDAKHYWYFSDEKDGKQPTLSESYLVVPSDRRQKNEGWGVSLCWWARMCGAWDDAKIDQIVDWLTSPTGLNYNIFRYNIGGGDDPENRNCDPHHMGRGKGLRAEMEGFKTSSDADYDWTRDEGQRKIMLKIREKRPDAIFEAFSNSCPYYMTYSGCCSGNVDGGKDNLKPEYYEEFAHYLVDVCKHYKDTYGIEFATLEPFNESATSFWYANGPQEGCHFDGRSQIAFIKVLAPILKASGLNTVISSSDETSVPTAIGELQLFRKEGDIVPMLGQFNVHTYGGNIMEKVNLKDMVSETGLPFWMSETGSGGEGLQGNLNLAQRMFDDLNYLQPQAWIDWQFVEEGNDQWCMVRGNFADQTYSVVKNLYVRMQVTRFIRQGYTLLSTGRDDALAAISPNGDEVVVVMLNTTTAEKEMVVDLSLLKVNGGVALYVTDSKYNCQQMDDLEVKNGRLVYQMGGLEIATAVIAVEPADGIKNFAGDAPYLLVPRAGTSPLTLNGGALQLSSLCVADTLQRWYLDQLPNGNYNIYTLQEGKKMALTDDGTYWLAVSALNAQNSGQQFAIEDLGDNCFKIVSAQNGKLLDLEGGHTESGTKVGMWEAGATGSNGHREWRILSVPFTKVPQGSLSGLQQVVAGRQVFAADGRIVLLDWDASATRYSVCQPNGVVVAEGQTTAHLTEVPLNRGVYIVNWGTLSKKIVIR